MQPPSGKYGNRSWRGTNWRKARSEPESRHEDLTWCALRGIVAITFDFALLGLNRLKVRSAKPFQLPSCRHITAKNFPPAALPNTEIIFNLTAWPPLTLP